MRDWDRVEREGWRTDRWGLLIFFKKNADCTATWTQNHSELSRGVIYPISIIEGIECLFFEFGGVIRSILIVRRGVIRNFS